MHELTHFLQVCEKRSGSNCDDYYVNEVEANKKQGKGLDMALNDALWSVHHTERCSKDYTASKDAYIRALKVYNNQ